MSAKKPTKADKLAVLKLIADKAKVAKLRSAKARDRLAANAKANAKAKAKVTARNGEVLPSAVTKRVKEGAAKAHTIYHAQWRKAVASFATNEGFDVWFDQTAIPAWRKAVANGKTVLGLADWRS